jgi:hypothetical protein
MARYEQFSLNTRNPNNMKITLFSFFTAASALLLFTACDSKEEQRREKALERKADTLEDQAKTTREKGEKKADAIESADPGLNSSATQKDAKATRTEAEIKADELEDAAKAAREQK